MLRIFSLGIHADYRCGRSGACCTSGWPIPIERETHERLSGMIAGGTLAVPRAGGCRTGGERPPFVATADAPPETPVVAGTDDHGACAFYEQETGLCAIHRQAGHDLLPVACRQFPRVSLADSRGLFVNLSHYCPTAARLLLREDAPLEVVEGPPAFPGDFAYDPFDARDALPPLLRPGVLTSTRAFDLWERRAIGMFAQAGRTAERALSQVAAFTEAVRAWTPGKDLERCIEEWDGGEHDPAVAVGVAFDASRVERACALVLDAVPDALRPSRPLHRASQAFDRWVAGTWPAFAAPVRRYLAAKIFGSWLAYQGTGLRTIVFSAEVALSVLEAHAAVLAERAARPLDSDLLIDAIRRTDELLVHLACREPLARRLSTIEANSCWRPFL